MRLSTRSITAAFLLGLIIGSAGGAAWQRRSFRNFMRRGPNTERMLNKLSGKLDLDAGQRKSVESVLLAKSAELEKLHKETRDSFERVRLSTQDEIRKVLKPDQQKKFDELSARWEQRHKRWWGDEGEAKKLP
jgi:hypothetical protein